MLSSEHNSFSESDEATRSVMSVSELEEWSRSFKSVFECVEY